ncbi:MAG: PA2169 family four-helix-bundle protein [Luteolibacter sp.]|uniref:PA2169 family four-helix-bundle protein n=1 Tax=Luteolibacter sp. TaxID=1962973 RepID=UPI003263830E
MPASDTLPVTDAFELQNVLTRYVDSYDGYTEAAKVVESPDLAAAFLEIAGRRKVIVEHVAALIERQGEKPDVDGSPEAAIHRWWLRLRAQMSTEELEATLAECVRGEKELERTVNGALEKGALEARHAVILAEIATELKAAIQTFETALGH